MDLEKDSLRWEWFSPEGKSAATAMLARLPAVKTTKAATPSFYEQGLSKLPERDKFSTSFNGNAADLAATQAAYLDALSAFEKAVEAKPDDSLAWFQIGRCRYRLAYGTFRSGSMFEEETRKAYQAGSRAAKDAFRKSIDAQPNFAPAHLGLARMHDALSDKVEEAVSLHEAVRIDPGLVDAHFELALNYSEAGDDESYRKEIAILEKLDPAKARYTEKLREMFRDIKRRLPPPE